METPNLSFEVLTLFVDDLETSKRFYNRIFSPTKIFEDDVSSVIKFGGLVVNLLQASEASILIEPRVSTTPRAVGTSALFTIRVENVDAVCDYLQNHGAAMLNGPINRPWGRRTAAFEDPSGHVWEIAEVLT